MRIWSIHPTYLDSKGLVAAWREGLLALHVLQGKTVGYKNHPQLDRFKQHPKPVAAMRLYLHFLCDEADSRSYNFDRFKLGSRPKKIELIPVTNGQLEYEIGWLKQKLTSRDPARLQNPIYNETALPHPLIHVVQGEIEPWEKLA